MENFYFSTVKQASSSHLYELNEHPTRTELESYRFNPNELTKLAQLKIAVHLPECTSCRAKIPPPSLTDFEQAIIDEINGASSVSELPLSSALFTSSKLIEQRQIAGFLAQEIDAPSFLAKNRQLFILSIFFRLFSRYPWRFALSALMLMVGALFFGFRFHDDKSNSANNMVGNDNAVEQRFIEITKNSSAPPAVNSNSDNAASLQPPETETQRHLKKSELTKQVVRKPVKDPLLFDERHIQQRKIAPREKNEIIPPTTRPQSSNPTLIVSKNYSASEPFLTSTTRGAGQVTKCSEEPIEAGIESSPEQIRFRWEKLPHVVKYHLYISDDSQILLEEFETETETSYVLKQRLETGKTYKWKIVATLADGRMIFGNSNPFTFGKKMKKDLFQKKGKGVVRCSQ